MATGLLGMMDDPASQGLLSLGLRLMSTPGNFGTAFGQAGIGAMNDMQQAQVLQQRTKQNDQYMLMQKLQMSQILEQQKKQEQLRTLAAQMAQTPQQVAMKANGGPTLAAASATPLTAPGFNYQGYAEGLAALGDPAGALAIQQALKKEQPKFSTAPQYDQNGRAFILSEQGQIKYLGGVSARDKLVSEDLGGKKILRSEYSATPVGEFGLTQSPNNIATVGASYANANAVREQANATRDAAKITANVAETTGLRKEFADLPEVKKYKNAIPAYQSVVAAAKVNNPQADINLIYGLAKLYDPDSVVREGEYDTIANSQSIPEWLKGQAQRLAGGGKLTPDTKRQIIQQAGIRIKTFKDEFDGAQSGYSGIAASRNLPDSSVFTPIGQGLRIEDPSNFDFSAADAIVGRKR